MLWQKTQLLFFSAALLFICLSFMVFKHFHGLIVFYLFQMTTYQCEAMPNYEVRWNFIYWTFSFKLLELLHFFFFFFNYKKKEKERWWCILQMWNLWSDDKSNDVTLTWKNTNLSSVLNFYYFLESGVGQFFCSWIRRILVYGPVFWSYLRVMGRH